MSTNVTCSDCLKRMAGLNNKTLRQQYRISVPETGNRWMAKGHAEYRASGSKGRPRLVALCLATPRNVDSPK